MTLIKSISGIRGTIGGKPGEALTPVDIVRFTSAYGTLLRKKLKKDSLRLVVGRDARVSGPMVSKIVIATLNASGIDVIDAGLSTTPTVEMAVTMSHSDGGIILTASHNPAEWNALKLLDNRGEFLTAADGEELLSIIASEELEYASYDKLGTRIEDDTFIERHIEKILALDLVDPEAIKSRDFTIAVDAVNSAGGIAIPALLGALGVKNVLPVNCEPDGLFAHNPEPLPENLADLASVVKSGNADLGFAVDPDVDRLAIVDENGHMFGEEYTLVAVADYVLQHETGNTVSNLSSSMALRDLTREAGGEYGASAVGEVNVVAMMKETSAVIGGEGNGGVIYPKLHYGRDALVGIALFLSHLARTGKTCSGLRSGYPEYHISKNKLVLDPSTDMDAIFTILKDKYGKHELFTIDGLKINFGDSWVHLRRSNTEAIIRVYSEAPTEEAARVLADEFLSEISKISC